MTSGQIAIAATLFGLAAVLVGVAVAGQSSDPAKDSETLRSAEHAWQRSAKTGSKANFMQGYLGRRLYDEVAPRHGWPPYGSD